MAARNIFQAFELSSGDLSTFMFWVRLKFIVVFSVPATWFIFSLLSTGYRAMVTRRLVALLVAINLISYATVLTNDYHHLFWSANIPNDSTPYFATHKSFGILFWALVTPLVVVNALSIVLWVRMMLTSSNLFRRHSALVVLALLVTCLFNLAHVLGVHVLPDVDMTPLIFPVVAGAFVWSTYRVGAVDLLPIARDVIIDGLRDAVIVLDERWRVLDANPAAMSLFSDSSMGILGRPLRTVFPNLACALERIDGAPDPVIEFEHQPADKPLVFNLTASAILQPSGGESGWLLMLHDVTEQKAAESRLKRAETRYRTLVEQIPAVTYIDRSDSTPLYVSPQLTELTGLDRSTWLTNRAARERIIHPEDEQRVAAELRMSQRSGTPLTLEYRLLRDDGRVVWVHDKAARVPDQNSEQDVWQGILFDITELKSLEEQLAHQAFHDPLTRLPNRRLLQNRIEQAVARLSDSSRMVAGLFFDLDNFKQINDSLGHDVGDQVLISLAHRLLTIIRSDDVAARLGGDEFIILLEDIDGPHEAIKIAERLIESLRTPFVIQGHELTLSSSIGIAFAQFDRGSTESLLRDADIAMYRAKRSGKSQYAVFDASMHVDVMQEIERESELRRGITQGQFHARYLPQIDITNGRITGVEVLAYWDHPKSGLLPANDFMALAEETGLITQLGQQVLREACADMRNWQDEMGQPLRLSANLSFRQLQRPDLVPVISEIIRETGLDPHLLDLELTEQAVMSGDGDTLPKLNGLKALGVRLAIDNFGTGLSSLSYLNRYPVDLLKIDQSFVQGLAQDTDLVIVRSIISLGHSLGLRVVAEGVETAEQLAQLRLLGCDFAQGFFFSRPLTAAAMRQLLLDDSPKRLRIAAAD